MNLFEEPIIDFLDKLNQCDVRYILVGGLATNYHGYSRTTGDVDLWIEDTKLNREKFVAALKKNDIEGADIFYTQPFIAGFTEIQLEKGFYVDLMRDLKYFKQELFEDCYNLADNFELSETLKIKVLNIYHLIAEKEKLPRPKDLEDLEQLRKIVELKNKKT